MILQFGEKREKTQSPTDASARFHQGSTKVLQMSSKFHQISWCLWLSGADPGWAAKRFCRRFHQGLTRVPPMFYQDSTFTSQMTVVSERFLEGSANCSLHLPPSLVPGSKLHELLTCLTHIPPSHGKRPIMSCPVN